VIQAENIGTVPFSHDVHTEMFGCDECHPEVFKAEVDSNKVGMKKMEAGESCGTCHDGDMAFGVSEDCATCHSAAVDMSIKAKDVDAVQFSHALHTEMFGCSECHPGIFNAKANSNQVGMRQMAAGASCGACHDGDTAFSVSEDCNVCHSAGIAYTKDVVIRDAAWAILFSHRVHTEMFDCDECHPGVFKARANSNKVGMKRMETGESCGACHDGDTAFDVSGDCATCHNKSIEIAMSAAGVGSVPFSHSVHTGMFGCDECHPGTFKARADSNQVGMKKMATGESCGACHDGDTAFDVSGDCIACHSNAVDMTLQTASVGDVPFSHSVHTGMFGCDECHPGTFKALANSNQVGMKKMEKGASCGACHDGDTAFGVGGDCVTCHSNAVDMAIQTRYVGAVSFSHSVHMEMFSCNECHPTIFRAQANSNEVGMKRMEAGLSCGACHDGDTAFGVKEACTDCHAGDVTFQGFGTTVFSHALHNDMFSCDECHPRIFKAKKGVNKASMDDMETGASCGACHDGTKAFGVATDCKPCHLN
jgi:c(7)-type cytochrome triheme protein